MTDPILQAIQYADSPEHQGAGYTLRILMVSGRYFDVVSSYADGELVLRRWNGGDKPHGDAIFINPVNVESVEILW